MSIFNSTKLTLKKTGKFNEHSELSKMKILSNPQHSHPFVDCDILLDSMSMDSYRFS